MPKAALDIMKRMRSFLDFYFNLHNSFFLSMISVNIKSLVIGALLTSSIVFGVAATGKIVRRQQ